MYSDPAKKISDGYAYIQSHDLICRLKGMGTDYLPPNLHLNAPWRWWRSSRDPTSNFLACTLNMVETSYLLNSFSGSSIVNYRACVNRRTNSAPSNNLSSSRLGTLARGTPTRLNSNGPPIFIGIHTHLTLDTRHCLNISRWVWANPGKGLGLCVLR